MFKTTHKVTLLSITWDRILSNLKVQAIPRAGELIYATEMDKYFEVIKVIHAIQTKHDICLLVKEYTNVIRS